MPVIIRQRVRARLGGRTHHDSAIQTRPRNSQDEYVRFSAVNNDSGRGAGQRHRDGSRTRTRARPQSHGSQVQTDGNEYIKIHTAQQKLVATTIPPTTTTTTARTVEEDVDYGFIRSPNFRPVHPVHPVDSRFQAPITYRPALSEVHVSWNSRKKGVNLDTNKFLNNNLFCDISKNFCISIKNSYSNNKQNMLIAFLKNNKHLSSMWSFRF